SLLSSILILLALPGKLVATGKLSRIEDPVVVAGEVLAPLLGAGLDRLSLMVWTADVKPVPFQVDEKDEMGEYVFAMSVKGTEITPSNAVDQDPSLDANDELVFMVFDAGDRCPEGSAPADAEKGVELEIVDPVDGGRAWLYLFSFEKDIPHSEKDYVKLIIAPERRVSRVEAKNYIVETVKNTTYYNYISLIHSDGTQSHDLIDHFKIRLIVSILFNTIEIPFAMDELFQAETSAFTDGPIRVISLGSGYMKGPAGIKLSGGRSVVKNYPNSFIIPIHLQVPLDAKVLLSDIQLHGANDFNENAYGTYYYDEHNPYNPEVVLDGKMSEAERKMDYKSDHDWLVVMTPYGTTVFRLIFPPEWDFLNKGLYYKDDPMFEDPPEDNPGVIAVGFDIDNFIDLKRGAYTYYFQYYFPHNFKVGDEKMILNIMDRPLEVKVHPIKYTVPSTP
ncbi:MAG: hypothetical protein JSU92_07445, partial [Deltaproteobacteria bacterium]